jgi:leucyl/phenylalanyl-tRNA--protein transferase
MHANDILAAYACGLFPMAEEKTDAHIHWIDPDHRGIIPLDQFHVSKSMLKFLRRKPFHVTINKNFEAVIKACAARPQTWINESIQNCYISLHQTGHAHSIECWDKDGKLAGGLYGLAINGAFFGESMFSNASNASKTALVHLVARLKKQGFSLLDCQFVNPHLTQFGCIEIPRVQYHSRLAGALSETGISFISPVEIYSSSASSTEDGAGLISCWDDALGSRQPSTVTS